MEKSKEPEKNHYNKEGLGEQVKESELNEVDTSGCFLCGETPVRVCFAAEEISLRSLLRNYFLRLKK